MNIYPLDISFAANGLNQTIHPVLLQEERETVLVDCGYPRFTDLLEKAANKHGLSLDAVTRIIVTHNDIDHVGSLAALRRLYPHIEIIAHELEAPSIKGLRKSERLLQAESLYLADSRTLIAGDAVVVEREGLAIANPQYALDLDQAVRSVRRLLDYDIERLVCYHGGMYGGAVTEGLRKLIADYGCEV